MFLAADVEVHGHVGGGRRAEGGAGVGGVQVPQEVPAVQGLQLVHSITSTMLHDAPGPCTLGGCDMVKM